MCQPMPKDRWRPVEFFAFLWLLWSIFHTQKKKSHQIPYVFNGYSHGDTLLKEIYIQHLSPTCLWYSSYYLIYILLSVLIAGSQQMENMYSDKHRKLQFYIYKLRWKQDVCSALGEKQEQNYFWNEFSKWAFLFLIIRFSNKKKIF